MAPRGRPKKPAGEKYILKAFKFPPELWEAFSKAVPASERSEAIRAYMAAEIAKRSVGKRSIPKPRGLADKD